MKKVLLIAGGGTLGTYTAQELLRLGHAVDVVCLEDKVSDNENLKFYKSNATLDYLKELFATNRYDGIVNFIHYPNYKDYIPYHQLLSSNTDHLIFLSSYRVYADLQHPITEDAPQLLDVIRDDPEFIAKENYALAKSRAERFLHDNPYPRNWTIVRPVISFSHLRLDLNMLTNLDIINAYKKGTSLRLPVEAKNFTAGMDWAGNSGKLIANLLFKKETIGEAYTVSTAPNLTTKQIADIYTELLGVKFEWVSINEYKQLEQKWFAYKWYYDRAYDRSIDCSKILRATGLTQDDFKTLREGIEIEIKKIGVTK